MNILFDANPLTKQKTGINYYVENIVRTLAKNYATEVQLTGYYFNFLGRSKSLSPDIPGITYKEIRWFPLKFLSICRRLGFQIPLNLLVPSASKFDLILFTDFVALPVMSKTPSCVVVYDLCFVDYPEYVATANAAFLQRFVPVSIKKSNAVICLSEFTKQRIQKVFDCEGSAITVAYPGNAVETIRQQKVQRNILLYTGTIEPRKNLVNMLKAYSQLPEAQQQAYKLVLAGGHGWKDEAIMATLEELQGKGLAIEYKGYVSDKEKAALYQQSAAVLILSHYEGFGMPILEAMAYDAAVLLSDIPVFHEVAGSAGYYCDKDDPTKISRELEAILEHPDKSKQAKYQAVLQKFTWDNGAESYMKVFRQLAKRKVDNA